jgi:WD40 repeat protein
VRGLADVEGVGGGKRRVFAEGPDVREVARDAERFVRWVPLISADGSRVLLYDDFYAYLWDLRRRERLWERERDEWEVLALSADGEYAILSIDEEVVFVGGEGEVAGRIGVGGRFDAVSWSAQDLLASGADDGSIALWRAE